jgi:hypothetical protein
MEVVLMNKSFKVEIGKVVFEKFDRNLSDSLFTKQKELERLSQAATLAEQMPMVMMPLREHGILKGNNTAHVLHLFQPNLWAQDYAHSVGQLGKMTVATSLERANASAEYKLETSDSLIELLRKQGKTAYDFLDSMREAALIESALYTRASGAEMDKSNARKIDTAFMRRAIRNDSMFRTILKHIGADEKDGMALLQFAEEIDLAGCLQKLSKYDAYLARRDVQIDFFTKINSEESIKYKTLSSNAFVDELIKRLYKKHPAAFKKIANLFTA